MTSNGPPHEKFAAWVADNPHVRFFDSRKRGYVSAELRPERLEVAFRAVADVRDPADRSIDLAPLRRRGRPAGTAAGV